jgi:hypothetical protein
MRDTETGGLAHQVFKTKREAVDQKTWFEEHPVLWTVTYRTNQRVMGIGVSRSETRHSEEEAVALAREYRGTIQKSTRVGFIYEDGPVYRP